jgi:hypothetical protein
VADAAIWTSEDGPSIADNMAAAGVHWEPADKSPGSRKHGWEEIRKRLSAIVPPWDRQNAEPGLRPWNWVREEPGLFVFRTCTSFLDTVPVLPRDDKDMDDVDTDAEDHIADEMRYRVRALVRGVKQTDF